MKEKEIPQAPCVEMKKIPGDHFRGFFILIKNEYNRY